MEKLEKQAANRALAVICLALAISPVALALPSIDELPSAYLPSGKSMYAQYCAACHGPEGKGDGPAAFFLKTPPADLTALSARNMGHFPRAYVINVLRFGLGPSAHGSSDMPTWGSIFQVIDKNNERAVQQRINRLADFLATLQKN